MSDNGTSSTSTQECMQIDLLTDNGSIQSLWLPAKNEGRYRLGYDDNFPLFIDVKNSKWTAVCYDDAKFIRSYQNDISSIEFCSSVQLLDGQLLRMIYMGEEYAIYSENVTKQSNIFRKYFIPDVTEIAIGRSNACDIYYPNILVSRIHAKLQRLNEAWIIEDISSTNGTFVNDRKITRAELSVGDVVYIMGLKLIFGVGFIAINDSEERVSLNPSVFKNADSVSTFPSLPMAKKDQFEKQPFDRRPRRRTAIEKKVITVEKPPMSLNSDKIPLLMQMGSSMLMGGSAALMGNYLMILTSFIFPLMTSKYSDKQKKDYERRRVYGYREYLKFKKQEISSEIQYEKAVLIKNYPEINKILDYPQLKSPLWERRKTDDDFLTLRVGIGDIPLIAETDFPKKEFSIENDPLETEMYDLTEKRISIESAPLLIDFKENFVCGIVGERPRILKFVNSLIISTTILHSYDEVKTVFLIDLEELDKLDYIKYLPHSWDNQRIFRFIATTESEAYQIGEYLTKELGNDINEPRELKKILRERPYYVVFALSKKVFDSMELLKLVMQCEVTCGVSIITAFDDVPKDSSLLFNLEASGENQLTYLRQIERADDSFCIDSFDDSKAKKSMQILSNIYLKVISQEYSLPKTLSFLEMFGVGKVEHLNPLRRWQESNPIKTLAAPVGVATDGSIFNLDLHQKYQGPHGLVAGMTGSGKSEFLITYILSMAINYHPYEVAFVLIDYKGGGLAGAFDDPEKGIHLPHLVGTITNLDGSTIQRSLTCLQSELTRRQRVFNQAKGITDDGTMDIYSYQKLYRMGKVSEAIPHLIIISDEFAELKQQKPEFMDSLISIARIGRSLGVHLILATQKPSGVVNEQIRSNTKFRVCLKVQDKSDSADMLNRPEAAELKEVGRFYLQVGYNEFFALGQSAWSGAEYYPTEEIVTQKDDSVQVIDTVGQKVCEVKPLIDRTLSHGTQLTAVVNMLSNLAEQENAVSKKLWHPELKRYLELSSLERLKTLKTEGGCRVVHAELGMVDDPENQEQFVFDYDFTHSKNLMIVGDSRSGKSTLIQSILCTLINYYSAYEVCFYIMDYSSRMLKLFKGTPWCGAVMTEENDAPSNFFKTIEKIYSERKRVFSENEISNFSEVTPEMDFPLVIVIIDNIAGLTSSKEGDAQLFKLSQILKDCANYGVKFIVSCTRYSDISIKIRQSLGDRLSLYQKEKFDYAESLVCKVDYMPPDIPGRGLTIIGGRPLEVQIASLMSGHDSHGRLQYLKQFINSKSEIHDTPRSVQRLSVTSAESEYADFAEQFKSGRIPLGIAENGSRSIALPLKQLTQVNIYFGNINGKVAILKNLIYAIEREKMDVTFIRSIGNSVVDSSALRNVFSKVNLVDTSLPSIASFRDDLMSIFKIRQKKLTDYCNANNIDIKAENFIRSTWKFRAEHMPPIAIIIESVADFACSLDQLSTLIFSSIMHSLFVYNIFLFGVFEPNDAGQANGSIFYSQFALSGTTLLFGGKYSEQQFCQLPASVTGVSQEMPYNVCLVKYKGAFYPLIMPCGHIDTQSTTDEDYNNIFE